MDWHQRYIQQARWTAALRRYLFNQAGLENAHSILEVGCGTGAVLGELSNPNRMVIHGLDIDWQGLKLAAGNLPTNQFICGNAQRLPYQTASFDLAFCHFFLLWVNDPEHALQEMQRVVRPDGAVLAFAEPDYGGRIDYPEVFGDLGRKQTRALHRQGADPLMGRQLAHLFTKLGFKEIETGVLGAQWKAADKSFDWESEWRVLRHDLREMVTEPVLDDLQSLDMQARNNGSRVLYVPTFYAWGRK